MPNNSITGTEGNDVLIGTAAADIIQGLGGNDTLIDNLGGPDELDGGDGDDVILVRHLSGTATVTVDGGAGNDFIQVATLGQATITTGAGSDVVEASSHATILDFTPGDGGDRLDWSPVLAALKNWDQASNPFAGGQWMRTIQSGNELIIQYSPTGDGVNFADYVYLFGVTAAQLTAFNLSGFALDGSAPTNLTLTGGGGDDRLLGMGGNDTIDGAAGNDTIFAGAGNDTVHGGIGNDYIDGELGSDTLYGDDGDDTIVDNYGYLGTLDGGAGDDTLTADLSAFNNSAAPVLTQYRYYRTLLGGDGDDTITFVGRNDTQATIDAGAGNDTISYRGSFANISASIQGGDGDDRIDISGTVTVDAGGGNDLVIIGADTPIVTLGSGVDTVWINPSAPPAGAHITDFQTGAGGDVVDLRTMLAGNPQGWNYSGNPITLTQSGNNVILQILSHSALLVFENHQVADFTAANLGGFPTNGTEPAGATINGTPGDDILTGTVGDDTINGLAGNDTINGGFNDDILSGGDGNDIIDSGGGRDTLDGGNGDDVLTSTLDDPFGVVMTGGAGNDTLTLSRNLQTAANISLDGGDGNDLINVTKATGIVLGGTGNDTVNLNHLTGRVDLGAGDDLLFAFGATLNAASGSLTLGAGKDTVTPQDKNVTTLDILDFVAGEEGDRLDLSVAWGSNPFGNSLTIIQQGANALINLTTNGGTTFYTLRNVQATDLSDYNLGVSTSLFYNPQPHSFTGTSGADTYISADGNDMLNGQGGDDTLYGAGGNDVIIGGDGSDTLYGGTGNDILFGGPGIDRLEGGDGNDQLWVDDPSDVVEEGPEGGTDIVYASVSYQLAEGQEVEILSTASNIGTDPLTLVGNSYQQIIYGNAGANLLAGGGGPDVLIGLGGNDTYLIADGTEQVFEAAGGGTDVVYTGVSYALAAGQEIEILSTTSNAGIEAIDVTGNELTNTIYGNAGANALRGGGGSDDVLIGLGGNDTYYIVQGSEHVFEAAGGGTDVVYTNMSYALAAGQEIEILSTISNSATDAIDLTGNEFANTIYGNDGANALRGGGGSGDVLIGLGGNDVYYIVQGSEQAYEAAGGGTDVVYTSTSYALTAGQEIEILSTVSNSATDAMDLTGNALANTIYGNNGANVINGGSGNDVLLGLGGADSFAFTTTLGAGNVDRLADFASGSDRILLDHAVFTGLGTGALPAGAFATGTAAGDADDRIIYDAATGALYFDADGNGAGAAIQFATLQPGAALTASDFQVI